MNEDNRKEIVTRQSQEKEQEQQGELSSNNYPDDINIFKDSDEDGIKVLDTHEDEIKELIAILEPYNFSLDIIRELYLKAMETLHKKGKEEFFINFIREKCNISDNDVIDDLHELFANRVRNVKPRKEIYIGIPETQFTFKITFEDKYYNINIIDKFVDIGLPVVTKEFKESKSRDKELCDLLINYAEPKVKPDQAENIVIKFNKKIIREYRKDIEALKINYEKPEDTESEEEQKPEQYEKPEIMQKAEQILKNGDPFKFFMDTVQTIHVGDELAFTAVFLARMNQSILNANGIFPYFNGGTGKGKTHTGQSFVICLPKKYVIQSTFSNKALYYSKKMKQAGMFILADDVKLNEDVISMMKRLETCFQDGIQYMSVNTDRKGEDLSIPARTVILFTSVEDQTGEELGDRQLNTTVDDSMEQDYSVFDMQVQKAMTGLDPRLNNTENILVCQALFDYWAKNLSKIIIPYANRIVWNDKKHRRNFDMFLDMIRGFTLSKFMQRGKRSIDGQEFLMATEEDFNNAAEFYNQVGLFMGSKLTGAEMDMAKAIASFKERGAESKDLQLILKLSQGNVSKKIKSLEEKLPQLYTIDSSVLDGTNDQGSIHSVTTRAKRYVLKNFDESNYFKPVYLSAEPIDYKKELQEAKKEIKQEETKNKIQAEYHEKNQSKLNMSFDDEDEEPVIPRLNIPKISSLN